MKYLLLVLATALSLTACGPSIVKYSLVAPAQGGTAFENADMKCSVAVLDDRRLALSIANKTESPLRVSWGNATFISAAGEGKLGYRFISGEKAADVGGVTSLEPGGSCSVEAWPEGNAYMDGMTEKLRPLYFDGQKSRTANLKGKPFGVKLVVEANYHSSFCPVLVQLDD